MDIVNGELDPKGYEALSKFNLKNRIPSSPTSGEVNFRQRIEFIDRRILNLFKLSRRLLDEPVYTGIRGVIKRINDLDRKKQQMIKDRSVSQEVQIIMKTTKSAPIVYDSRA